MSSPEAMALRAENSALKAEISELHVELKSLGGTINQIYPVDIELNTGWYNGPHWKGSYVVIRESDGVTLRFHYGDGEGPQFVNISFAELKKLNQALLKPTYSKPDIEAEVQ